MENPNQANSFNQDPKSENQDKIVNVYFGVFFDAMDMSLMGHYLNPGEYLRKGEEKVSEAKDSSIYKTVNEVAAWADFAANTLPDNPVSKAVKKGLEVKNTVENKADDLVDKVGGISDKVSGLEDKLNDKLDKVPTSFGTGEKEEEEKEEKGNMLMSKRSIISKLEPTYYGDFYNSDYNFRIYTIGAVTNNEVKQKKSTDDQEDAQIDENARKQLENEAIEKAVAAIKQKIDNTPTEIFLHFDIFGYSKDPAVNNFITEIDQFKQITKVKELSIDFKGLYDNFYDPNEVMSSMGSDTMVRFRSIKL
jgi:hypothetical protein